MSNIKVTVEWEAPVVFAGEEIRCIITFKNSTSPTDRSRSLSPYAKDRLGSGRERWKQDLPNRPPLPKRAQSLRKADDKSARPQVKSHRPTLSLIAPSSSSRFSSRGSSIADSGNSAASKPRGHVRSLSIVSLGPDTINNKSVSTNIIGPPPTRRYHNRATSLQTLSARDSDQLATSPTTSPLTHQAGDLPHRRSNSSISPANGQQQISASMSVTSSVYSRSRTNSRASTSVPQSPTETSQRPIPTRSSTGNNIKASPVMPFSPPRRDNDYSSNFTSKNKVLSPISNDVSPRSSLEIYSQSNHSTETLASEYIVAAKTGQPPKPHSRRGTHLTPIFNQMNKAETLMMGYAQLSGSFTLDGSLINMTPFESVKMKGVIGGQGGGGVVGVEKSKRESGLLGSFGWSGIGQSLGELIGGQEMSSIKEMKGIASTKSIPIISTPQSILFVNLSLQPGESKSFSYIHQLPENIPPTYKGRAIKIDYQLVIGTQRPQQMSRTQSIRHADFTFKVLSGVNARGELPIYDLKNPHIILRDLAISQAVENEGTVEQRLKKVAVKRSSESEMTFASYVDKLLSDRPSDLDGGLLSPTDTHTQSTPNSSTQHPTKDFIELAILRGNAPTPSRSSTNRFDIHRGGQRVATIVLARSAYRLGERLIAGLDFRDALLPCYAVHAFLETIEEVDESIALRSSASISRATRRIQASCFENTVCTQRLTLGFTIPTNAAPEFRTSSINLKWSLRIEFTTGRMSTGSNDSLDLLEEVNEDERGSILAAAQELPCEMFDVLVPIRVYGGLGEARNNLAVSSIV